LIIIYKSSNKNESLIKMITEDFDVFVKRYKEKTNTNRNMEKVKVKEHVLPKLTITPISADTRNKANIDYVEQMERVSNGLPLVWDDSKFNQSKKGDLFGFWMYKEHVRIHVIEGVSKPHERLPSWSTNVGQGDRNVVQLSTDNVVIPWEIWINNLDGAKRCMGTAPVKKGLDKILMYSLNKEYRNKETSKSTSTFM